VDILTGMYKITAKAAGELWASQEASLAGLSDLAGRLVCSALHRRRSVRNHGPAVRTAGAAAALRLHTRLSVLCYHRADAYAAAWHAAGLTSTAIQHLPAGPARDAIESDTNDRAGQPYATLGPDERIALLAGLAALPGDTVAQQGFDEPLSPATRRICLL
jgi:hypothetical protein